MSAIDSLSISGWDMRKVRDIADVHAIPYRNIAIFYNAILDRWECVDMGDRVITVGTSFGRLDGDTGAWIDTG